MPCDSGQGQGSDNCDYQLRRRVEKLEARLHSVEEADLIMPCSDSKAQEEYQSELPNVVDDLTSKLCSAMQVIDANSLLTKVDESLRIWWVQHCKQDERRVKSQFVNFLSGFTPHEKKLLYKILEEEL